MTHRLSGTEPVVRASARRAAGRPRQVERGRKSMDSSVSQSANRQLRLGPASRMRPPSTGEEGLRAASINAMSQLCGPGKIKLRGLRLRRRGWVERTRRRVVARHLEWRRLGTQPTVVLIGAYCCTPCSGSQWHGRYTGRKRTTRCKPLQNDVERLEKENGLHVDQISRRSRPDPAAIEKEAREQLHYTRPGEVILVSPALRKSRPPRARNSSSG